MQVSEVPQGSGLIILCSFSLRTFDSSANRSLDPNCVLKCSHLLRFLVCKSGFWLPKSFTACCIVPQVSRVPTQLRKVQEMTQIIPGPRSLGIDKIPVWKSSEVKNKEHNTNLL